MDTQSTPTQQRTMSLTSRQILILLISLTSALALGSLLLGLFAGHGILLWMGLTGFVSMLDRIPLSSAVVTSLLSPIVFAIGVGLLWKGTSETLITSMVPGTIQSSWHRLSPGDTQDEYCLHSRVTYAIDGVSYISEGQHSTSEPTLVLAEKRIADLRAGDPVQVFYMPGDPLVISLDAPPRRTLIVLLVGIWITLMALGTTFLHGILFAR